MNKQWIATALLLLVLGGVMLFSNGCNAWHGAGQDVEQIGKDMK